jgi:hypothetical protein
MDNLQEQLLEFIQQVGATFGIEQFFEPEILFTPHEETTLYSLVWTEVIWVDRRISCRLYILPKDVELNYSLIEYFFDVLREQEVLSYEDFLSVCVLWKVKDAEEFWYIRHDHGQVGLFHSTLSIDAAEDDEIGEGEIEDR